MSENLPTEPRDPEHVARETGVVVHAAVTEERLEDLLPVARSATGTDAMGAVDALTYTAHPDVDAHMQQLLSEIIQNHPEVRAWVAHRVGPLQIGEMAFLVVVAAAHRGPAFAAVADIADRVKSELPRWKEQALSDGSTAWVGLR